LSEPVDILRSYWGHDGFRPLQSDIIDSVIDGNDTLALLPTGGGKSICFQVPALALEGICIVVSPLIALMKDQVQNLKDRNIKAVSVTSELDHKQIDALFDRCIYEDIKFLYLSPERLNTELAKVRIAQMNVAMIAVDEAHCISEWGYDFRPSYLNIAAIREIIPNAPLIALTASATNPVVKDIADKLLFKPGHRVFRKSFARSNLSYQVNWTENKFNRIIELVSNLEGSGIIYMRNRKGTQRVSQELQERGISIDFYHAGLSTEERSKRQSDWMMGKLKIIVATNAFGMGIDKSDVRVVVHLDIPDTLENYYQECGRAGRDEQDALAISLLTERDVEFYKSRILDSFPEMSVIKDVYQSLGSFFQLAVGSGEGESFVFDISQFSDQFSYKPKLVRNSLKFLELDSFIQIIEHANHHSSVQILSSHERIRNLKEGNEKVRPLLEVLLRSYGSLFDEPTNISEWLLAKRSRWPLEKVEKVLEWLSASGYIDYQGASSLPLIRFLTERLSKDNISISDKHYKLRKKVIEEKSRSVIQYLRSGDECRSQMILKYFGETKPVKCGKCDICLNI
jgi:ATP-dependent DNA helicase RecQ